MTARSRCFFDVKVDGSDADRISFELYNDICPRTCENFRCLCTGEKGRATKSNKKLYYKGCLFHRVVKNFMIQSGDFTEGNGTGGDSIYGGSFADENFQIKHDRPYLLSMANLGADTNESQFFITTAKASHLDGKHVVFGHVISGQSVVDAIENLPVDPISNRPLKDAIIARCGELEFVAKIHKSKKRKVSNVDESDDNAENAHDQSSSSSETDKKKAKHDKKAKKKEKHRRKKEAKRLAKKSSEEQNDIAKTTEEILKSDLKGTMDYDEVPEPKSLLRSAAKEKEKSTNDDIFRSNNYHSATKVDSNGRPVKGRGAMRYTGKSRSRSRTPPHWRSAAEGRKRLGEQTNENTDASVPSAESTTNRENSKRTRSFQKNGDSDNDVENTLAGNNNNEDAEQGSKDSNNRSHRHEKHQDNSGEEEPLQPVVQSSVVRPTPRERESKRTSPVRQRRDHRTEMKSHRSTSNKHREIETSNHNKHTQNNSSPSRQRQEHDDSHAHNRRRRRSQTPTDGSTEAPSKSEHPKNISSEPLPTSASSKRIDRGEESSERREGDSRIKLQTNSIQLEPANQSIDIPQQSGETIVKEVAATVSKSKWDDDDDTMTTDSLPQNQNQSEPFPERKASGAVVDDPEESASMNDKPDEIPLPSSITIEKQEDKSVSQTEPSSSSQNRKEKDSSTRKYRQRRTSSRDRRTSSRDRERHRRTSSRDRQHHYSSSSRNRYREYGERDNYYRRRNYDDRYGNVHRRRYSPPASSRHRYFDRQDRNRDRDYHERDRRRNDDRNRQRSSRDKTTRSSHTKVSARPKDRKPSTSSSSSSKSSSRSSSSSSSSSSGSGSSSSGSSSSSSSSSSKSKSPSDRQERVTTPPTRKRLPTPPNPEDENVFVSLQTVKPREPVERKQIKIELSKSVPLPPSSSPVRLAPPPPPPPLYDPDEVDEPSNTPSHLLDRIGEHEDMELDDLDEPESTPTGHTFSQSTLTEEARVQTAPALASTTAPVASLYDNFPEDEIDIPMERNQKASNDTDGTSPMVVSTRASLVEDKSSKKSKRRSASRSSSSRSSSGSDTSGSTSSSSSSSSSSPSPHSRKQKDSSSHRHQNGNKGSSSKYKSQRR